MPQLNGLSNVIQDPATEAVDMDYDFNPSNKRKISNTHTQRPNHAIQFNSQPFIPPVVITLVSEPKAFHLLSLVEKHFLTKELSAIIGPLSSNIKWSKSGELVIFPSSRKQKEQLLRLDLVKEFQIKPSVSRSELESRGIIHNVPLINAEEDLLQLLADQGVKSLRSSTLPPDVVIAHELFRIKKYIPRPLICYKCWRLGHHESTCGYNEKCRSCAAPHDKNSDCTGTRCCATCGQLDHFAGMMSCPLYAERQEAIKNKAIIGGDFNGHSEVWDNFHATNSCGRKISEFLLTDPNWTLSTPKNLNTRPNIHDYSSSTIDLTFTTSDLSPLTSIHTGPYWSSDHLPIIIDIDLITTQPASLAPRWKFDDKMWGEWNAEISSTLNSQFFSDIGDPATSHSSFTNAIIEASTKLFKKATRAVRKAHNKWKESLLPSDKINLNHLEAIKKKTILAAKNYSWSNFIDNLGIPKNTTVFWNFTKNMLRGHQESPLNKYPLTQNGKTACSHEDKAKLLLDEFCPLEDPLAEEPVYNAVINRHLQDDSPHPLNNHLSSVEISNCLKNLKSKAMGPDHIHNKMLSNLNPVNQLALTHLINILFSSGFVPHVWKRASVVPLLKSGKDPSRTDSYRPISLTSCLAKVMERAINNRLHWYLDKNKCLPKFQTGFRKNCSTMDNIIKLESSIKSAFNNQKICSAAFLDLTNAYPSSWITGITYKLTKMNVRGTILRWLHHFLNGRKLQVKIGNTLSEERTTLKGVPQGLIFYSKLSWEQHVNEVNTCIQRRGNILKALTSKKTILPMFLLLRIYKALIRSKLDYGASGCLKSTPKALLHIETDIPPVKVRWQMLATNYFLKLSNKPFNPAFKAIKYMHNKLFPLSKTQAASNPSQTKIIFNKIIAPLNHPNHVIAYTDGSVHTSASPCDIYIPKLLIQEAWLLTKHTNIFNAELYAILHALKALSSHDNFDEITIFSDSKASIQAISNYRWDASPIISEIIQFIYNYREAVTNVTLHWIPSHCGIQGNCVADNLASSRATALEGIN
uniref:RNase H type-1 domain-containing protein n=1 Tax=Daphnia galeata TaxID=27404 RepID=A0A8J2RPR5_9CRUS|nr:unnamed protein product [Daphnia galeata]